MTKTFSYEFLTSGTPEEAQARLNGAITERLRRPSDGAAAGNAQQQLRLSEKTATSLSYTPRLVVPLPISLSVWLGRRLRREHVDVTFSSPDSKGDTRVVVSGKVGRGTQCIADREFWSGVLGSG